MKPLLYTLTLLTTILPTTSHAQTTTPTTPTTQNLSIIPLETHQKERHNLILNEIKREKPEILFLGDSITHQFGGARHPNDPTTPYGKDTWNHYYAPRKALNCGYSGEKTEMMLWRLQHGELDGYNPKVAIILAGINNCGNHNGTPIATPEQTAEAIFAITKLIHQKSPNTQILLLALFPRNQPQDNTFCRTFPKNVNAIIAPQSRQFPYITYLDITPELSTPNGETNPQFFYDALHPNPNGYALWAKLIEPTLAKLLHQTPINPPTTQKP